MIWWTRGSEWAQSSLHLLTFTCHWLSLSLATTASAQLSRDVRPVTCPQARVAYALWSPGVIPGSRLVAVEPHEGQGRRHLLSCGAAACRRTIGKIIRTESRNWFHRQEQQRVADGPGNAQYMSIRQVSLRRGTCGHCNVGRRCCCCCCCYGAM